MFKVSSRVTTSVSSCVAYSWPGNVAASVDVLVRVLIHAAKRIQLARQEKESLQENAAMSHRLPQIKASFREKKQVFEIICVCWSDLLVLAYE